MCVVNAANENDVDGSKDFSEKEISISCLKSKQIFCKKEIPCTKIPESKHIKKQVSSIDFLKASRTTPNNTTRPSLLHIGAIREEKIKKSKDKAKRKIYGNNVFVPFSRKNVDFVLEYPNFDFEIFNEFKRTTKNDGSSFGKFSSTENDGSTRTSLDAKYYANQNRWIDCKVVLHKGERFITISYNTNESFTLGMDDLKCVKVEDNRRVVWIKISIGTIKQLGILLKSVPEAEFLMMALDFLWKRSCRKNNIFLNCDNYIQCSESPLLHSSDVQWKRASNQIMEYLGQYYYHLKTAQKEIKSLQAVNIYLK